MYICSNCKELFEEPYFDDYFGYCPHCDAKEKYETAKQCLICGEYYEDAVTRDDICIPCMKKIVYERPDIVWKHLQYEDGLTYFSDWLQYAREGINETN